MATALPFPEAKAMIRTPRMAAQDDQTRRFAITHEEATLLAGLLAAFRIIRMLVPPYVEANPAAADLTDQMLAAMTAIEEGVAPFRQPRRKPE